MMSDTFTIILSFILGSLTYRIAFGCNRSVFILENLTKRKISYWKKRYYSLRNDFITLTDHPDVAKILKDIQVNNVIKKRKK